MAGENLLIVDDSPTILKVVESALSRAGYHVETAQDVQTGLQLARSLRPAMILVDSLIRTEAAPEHLATPAGIGPLDGATDDQPTGGSRLCGALAADSALVHTPVVLMTAKGEDLETRYAHAPNVIDYITKPFSPDALVAVVAHVIEKTNARTGDGASRAGANGPGGVDGARAVTQALSRSAEGAPVGALTRFKTDLAECLGRLRPPAGARGPAALVTAALSDEVLAGLLADAGFVAVDAATGPDLAGRLGATSLSEILSSLGQQGQTGTLRIFSAGARLEVFFSKGAIAFAAAVGVAEEFLLGRFAVEAGDIAPDVLARVLDARARVSGQPPLFGRDLVDRGLITPEQLQAALRRQTAELIYEALRWPHGTFQFWASDQLPERAQEAALQVSVDTLLLEGFRRVDEWRLIERDIQTFDLVFLRVDDRIADLPRGTLTRDEIAVLDALSGKSSVREVVRSLRMGSFDVSKILYRLLRTKLIRRRVQPTASA